MVDVDYTGALSVPGIVRAMEETEYAFLRSRGLSVVLSDDKGLMGFPRLDVSTDLFEPAFFDEVLTIQLRLIEMDGKRLRYRFSIDHADGRCVALGTIGVAVCRFPSDAIPYAVLTPQYVIDALKSSQ